MGPLKPKAFQGYEERSRKRSRLIRTLWGLAET